MNNTQTPVSTEELFKQHPPLKRLLWVLQHNEGFGLYFARCNVPSYRKQLVAAIVERCTCPVIEISLNQLDANLETTEIDIALADYLQDKPPQAAVFFYDLETLLPSKETELQHRTLQQINWRRNAYARLQRNLVIWLPDYALRILARGAPDFFDWYSGVYEFDVPESQRANFITDSLNSFDDERTHAEDRLTVAEKRRWLKVLLSLKDETQPDTPSGKQSLAKLLNDLGRLYYSLGEYEQTLEYYQRARIYYLEVEDRKGEAGILNAISIIYYLHGDSDTALQYLQDALKIQQEIGEHKGGTLRYISHIYSARGNYDTALQYLQDALKTQPDSGNQQSKRVILNHIGEIYRLQRDYDTALQYLQDALKICQETSNQQGEATTLDNISLLYKARSDYDTALQYSQNALNIQQDIGDRKGEGITLNNLSAIYQTGGDYDAAMQHLQDALKIQHDLGNQTGLCTTLFNLGQIDWAKDNQAEAQAQWISAYKIAKQIDYAQALEALDKLGKQFTDAIPFRDSIRF
jgi:tetratricopeptide (TPR) repeat protein